MVLYETTGREYELRLLDTTVLTFVLARDLTDLTATLGDIVSPTLLPPGLDATAPDGLDRWLHTRALPVNRRFAGEICAALGIAPGDVSRVTVAGLGLSLNDSYWVAPAGSPLLWGDVNLYENDYGALLAAVAYTGLYDGSDVSGLTPELTTGGTLRKAWRIGSDGTRLLYKGSSEGIFPGEWLSEVLASQVASAMGVTHVDYWHDRWEGTDCSVCPCFCTPSTSYFPMALATGSSRYATALATAWELGGLEDLCDMMVLDALICNDDRHLTNFGLLYDARSREALGLAPVFDNGRGLCPNSPDADPSALAIEMESRLPKHGETFERLAATYMGERQLEKLARLDGLDFDWSELPEGLEPLGRALSHVVSERARLLSETPCVDRDVIAEACERYLASLRQGPTPTGRGPRR